MTGAGGVRARLDAIFRAGLAAVEAGEAVARAFDGGAAIAGRPLAPEARLVVLAAGKAAAAMGAALEAVCGDRIAAGIAVTKDGHGLPLAHLSLREAAHPVPDARSERAARDAIALVESARSDDVLVVLLSGGASSLLAGPASGLSLSDLATTTAALLEGGAEIDELNAVRKHLSALAGGRLAERAACERIEVLAISDVPGDHPDVIASGPLTADPTRFADALAVLERRDPQGRVPARVRAHLAAGARGEIAETPAPGASALDRVRYTVVATNAMAVDAARAESASDGVRTVVVPNLLRGEARAAGRRLADLAAAARGPLRLVAGGETAVTVRGDGRGGRNQELALAAAVALDGRADVALLAGGTDGSDGPTDAAGAFADGGTVARSRARGLDARAALANNDSHGFFRAEGGCYVTGPTRTNVMDLAIVDVGAGPAL